MNRIYIWIDEDGETRAAFSPPPEGEISVLVICYEGDRPILLDAGADEVGVNN